MNQVAFVNEFKGLIRHELDIESLLRMTLEFVLGRTGPTNAAVFLPTTSGDYSLGAYVNYDCPKDTVDILLDHMANVIAPKFEHLKEIVVLDTPEALDAYIGHDADWLGESAVAAFTCRHPTPGCPSGETLAIVLLFRDRRTGFSQPLVDQLQTIGDLFASQLARVIQVHHRHLPKEKWGRIGDPDTGGHHTDDDSDLAA